MDRARMTLHPQSPSHCHHHHHLHNLIIVVVIMFMIWLSSSWSQKHLSFWYLADSFLGEQEKSGTKKQKKENAKKTLDTYWPAAVFPEQAYIYTSAKPQVKPSLTASFTFQAQVGGQWVVWFWPQQTSKYHNSGSNRGPAPHRQQEKGTIRQLASKPHE